MEALRTPTRERKSILFSCSTSNKQYYTREEFMNELAKRLGRHYGLNDIREAL